MTENQHHLIIYILYLQLIHIPKHVQPFDLQNIKFLRMPYSRHMAHSRNYAVKK